jgi:hypothetical protein
MNATATQLDKCNELLVRLAESRSVTDDLLPRVRTDALYDPPIPERHRLVFDGQRKAASAPSLIFFGQQVVGANSGILRPL